MPASISHYLGIVGLGSGICEGIFDTGAAKTMIDKRLADKLKLKVEKAREKGDFGSYAGPSGKSESYYGKITGPIEIQVGKDIFLYADEIKVI